MAIRGLRARATAASTGEMSRAEAQQGTRNLIINGDFGIWQRGGGAFATNNAYTADRWRVDIGGGTAGTWAVARSTFAVGESLEAGVEAPPFYLRFQQSIAGSGNSFKYLQQKIEGVRNLSGKTATISFYARCPLGAQTIGLRYEQVFGTGGLPSATVAANFASVNVGTTWAKYSVTVSVPSIAGKILGNNGDDHIGFLFSLPLNIMFAFDVANVMINEGDVAAPFSRAAGPIEGAELALCQRYYNRAVSGSTPEGQAQSAWIGYFNADNAFRVRGGSFPVRMRKIPTGSVSSTTHLDLHKPIVFSGPLNTHLTGAFTITTGTDAWGMHGIVSSATKDFCQLYFNTTAGFIEFDAEL